MRTTDATWTIGQIRSANERAGKYWFSPNTMSFFNSEVDSQVYEGPGGIYFVTSEAGPVAESPRRWSVRRFDPETANVNTHGAFGEFQSLARARAAARHAAKGWV